MQLQSCIRNTGFPGTLRAKGSKLAGDNVAHDANYEKSKENQDSIEEVSQEGNVITVKVDVDSLNEFIRNGTNWKLSLSYIEIYNEKVKCLLSGKC